MLNKNIKAKIIERITNRDAELRRKKWEGLNKVNIFLLKNGSRKERIDTIEGAREEGEKEEANEKEKYYIEKKGQESGLWYLLKLQHHFCSTTATGLTVIDLKL